MSRPRTRRELQIRRALNASSSRWTTPAMRKRMGLPTTGVITSRDGITVIRASRHAMLGRSTDPRGFLTHIVGAVYTAWSHGQLVGALVKWKCGGESVRFRLDIEPGGLVCPFCLAAFGSSLGARVAVVPSASEVRR